MSLETLVTHLDRERFEPLVLFYSLDSHAVVDSLRVKGIQVFVLEEGRATRDRFAGPRGSTEVRSWLPDRLRRGLWQEPYRLARGLRDYLRKDRRFRRPLEQFFRRHRVDLVHLNNGLHSHRATLLALRSFKLPCVCHVRSLHDIGPLERCVARGVDRFIYISRAVEEQYESCRIAPGRGRVIHNVTAPAPPLEPAEKQRVRAELGCGADDLLVVNIGRLVGWKGQDVFLDALRRLGESGGRRVKSLVVGEPDDTERSRAFAARLRQLIAAYDLADRVTLTGHRADAQRLMAAADVVVHTATTAEPFGRVIIEGMGAGAAVIGAAAGGVPDIIDDGETGLLTAPGDATALAAALGRLRDDAELRQRLGAAGRLHVQSAFDVASHVAAVEELYAGLCSSRAAVASL